MSSKPKESTLQILNYLLLWNMIVPLSHPRVLALMNVNTATIIISQYQDIHIVPVAQVSDENNERFTMNLSLKGYKIVVIAVTEKIPTH